MFPQVVLGLSDHTHGHATVLGAVALGARVIEKHFTDDTTRVGPDHPFSMTPVTWRDMVDRTRELEKALGSADKFITANEKDTTIVQRRCVRAARDIKAGEMITREMLDVLRPATTGAIKPAEINAGDRHACTKRSAIRQGNPLDRSGRINLSYYMRVLYFTNGQSPHDLRFTKALAQTPHEIFVLCLEGIESGWPEKITPVSWNPNEKNWKSLRLQAPKLKTILDILKPDIVHAGPVQGPAFLAAVAGFHPLVTMSWGSDLLLEARRNWQTRRVTHFTLSSTDVLVGDSKCIEEEARNFGYRGPYFQFPWGVDLKHFMPTGSTNLRTKLGWQDKTVLLSMRSFEKLYDVKSIIQAFCISSELRQDMRLLVFGQGTQEPLLKKIVREYGVEDKVYFGGKVSLEELPDVYRSADLYISASHSDGSSVSLMEALACGLPVLVSDIPGNREWIVPGKNGWLFKTGNVNDLGNHLLQFDKESSEILAMKVENRKLAEERADWTRNFPVLLQAYEKAIEIHGGQG